MSDLARAMAPMVNMCSSSEPGKTVITITLSRETMLYEILSNAYEYARSECWDEEPEDGDPA